MNINKLVLATLLTVSSTFYGLTDEECLDKASMMVSCEGMPFAFQMVDINGGWLAYTNLTLNGHMYVADPVKICKELNGLYLNYAKTEKQALTTIHLMTKKVETAKDSEAQNMYHDSIAGFCEFMYNIDDAFQLWGEALKLGKINDQEYDSVMRKRATLQKAIRTNNAQLFKDSVTQ
jgi:hypothetical protein